MDAEEFSVFDSNAAITVGVILNASMIPLESIKTKEKIVCVYFIYRLETKKLIYIGKSADVKSRLSRSHPVYVRKEHYVYVLPIADESKLLSIEAELINLFKPLFNITTQ